MSLRVSGLQQIEAAMAEVSAEQQSPRLSPLYRAVLAGRVRELQAAQGLLNRLLATPQFPIDSETGRSISVPTPSAGDNRDARNDERRHRSLRL